MADWKPTNADDVTLIVSQVIRDENGNRSGTQAVNGSAPLSGAVVVDDFSIETDEDLEALTGIGNYEALGITKGDVDHSFSFTVQGEDADLFQNLARDDGTAVELEIIVKLQDYQDKLVGAYAGTRNLSISNGDAVEMEVEGIAKSRDDGTVDE